MAEAVQIEPVSLSRLETGDRALSLSTLARISTALGVPLGDLLDIKAEIPEAKHGREAAEVARLVEKMPPGRRKLLLALARELAG